MEPRDYIVQDIKGEYAYLQRTDAPESEPLMIAIFLLPHGIDIDTKIHYENLQYSIVL